MTADPTMGMDPVLIEAHAYPPDPDTGTRMAVIESMSGPVYITIPARTIKET